MEYGGDALCPQGRPGVLLREIVSFVGSAIDTFYKLLGQLHNRQGDFFVSFFFFLAFFLHFSFLFFSFFTAIFLSIGRLSSRS